MMKLYLPLDMPIERDPTLGYSQFRFDASNGRVWKISRCWGGRGLNVAIDPDSICCVLNVTPVSLSSIQVGAYSTSDAEPYEEEIYRLKEEILRLKGDGK